jgi:hypothetical protein
MSQLKMAFTSRDEAYKAALLCSQTFLATFGLKPSTLRRARRVSTFLDRDFVQNSPYSPDSLDPKDTIREAPLTWLRWIPQCSSGLLCYLEEQPESKPNNYVSRNDHQSWTMVMQSSMTSSFSSSLFSVSRSGGRMGW